MKLDVNKLKKGTILAPVAGRGPDAWLPYITVLGTGAKEGLLTVRFSDGRVLDYFNPNGYASFLIVPTPTLENK